MVWVRNLIGVAIVAALLILLKTATNIYEEKYAWNIYEAKYACERQAKRTSPQTLEDLMYSGEKIGEID